MECNLSYRFLSAALNKIATSARDTCSVHALATLMPRFGAPKRGDDRISFAALAKRLRQRSSPSIPFGKFRYYVAGPTMAADNWRDIKSANNVYCAADRKYI